ncbi:transporter substrate-binding domain-containing protein [Phyllobacterium endophyticum]|uniref:transporter substrate-binding domain-containing protein n=1 Tax=Phyllobacterium endophyticum TaxID=1149773 RepID=UPI003CCE6D9F
MKGIMQLMTAAALLAATLPNSQVSAGEVLERVRTTKTLKIAVDASYPPNSFINDKNELDGFDVDVGKTIAERLGAKPEFVTPSWDVITAGQWRSRWDISVGQMTPTRERAKKFDFPAVYVYEASVVAVHKDSKATTLSDLNGKVVSAAPTTTQESYLKHDLVIDAAGAPPFEYKFTPGEVKSIGTALALDDLRLGDGVRIDALVSSRMTVLDAIKSGYPIKQLGDPVFYAPGTVAIELGDKEFREEIAAAVAKMRNDGTLTKFSIKWFGADVTVAK